MLGFLAQAGWILALGGFSSCSSSRLGVWLHGGGGTWLLQSMAVSLGSAMPRRSAARRCCWWSRNVHTRTIDKGNYGNQFSFLLHCKAGNMCIIPRKIMFQEYVETKLYASGLPKRGGSCTQFKHLLPFLNKRGTILKVPIMNEHEIAILPEENTFEVWWQKVWWARICSQAQHFYQYKFTIMATSGHGLGYGVSLLHA